MDIDYDISTGYKFQDYGVNQLIDTPFWEKIQKIISNISEEDLIDGHVKNDNVIEGNFDKKLDKEIRESKIIFLDDKKYPEIFDDLFRIVDRYNENISQWRYDICLMEDIQYGVYSKGGFFDWHVDKYVSPIWISSKNNWYNRKISISIFLNDPDEYEGGELDIETQGPLADPRYDTFKLPKGSIVIFPSNKWHRVRPVTSGVRKSLVVWVGGPPIR